jgi:hypothetical protein
MADKSRPSDGLDDVRRARYELAVEDTFNGDALNESLWFPYHLPQWSSRTEAAARYDVAEGLLKLRIDADQPPWCPEYDGNTRVSSLQTGVFTGSVDSTIGQHRFRSDVVVREAQRNVRLYTPPYGLFELRAKATADPSCMVALWMIGYEDQPNRSAEICICEIFGRDVNRESAAVGMGVHPFGDATIADEFSAEVLPIDVTDFHVYTAEWTPDYVAFFIDDALVKTVEQSPDYPMQFMLGIYEFRDEQETAVPRDAYPKQFVIDYFRGYQRRPPLGHT